MDSVTIDLTELLNGAFSAWLEGLGGNNKLFRHMEEGGHMTTTIHISSQGSTEIEFHLINP